jgi:uncharacterized protein (UPF0297 family)
MDMRKRIGFLLLVVSFSITGCAHKINLTPPLNTLDLKGLIPIEKNVGYYISPEDMTKEVVTPGGGGDKVKYTPYADLEPALKQALDNVFADVYQVQSLDDKGFLVENKITYVFIPNYTTNSSSSSVFTWPPTDFTITMLCKTQDDAGNVVWESTVEGNGKAEFAEFKHDMSLSARRAAKAVFVEFEKTLQQTEALN